MSGLRKLRRAGLKTQYEVEPLRKGRFSPLRKMSEIIQEFAEPILETIEDDDYFHDVISFAIICWNLSFLPQHEQKKMLKRMVNDLCKDYFIKSEAQRWAHLLLDYKKTFYADEKRMVANFEIIEEKGDRRLIVASTPTKS